MNTAHSRPRFGGDIEILTVLPGEHLVTDSPQATVSTLLGSCVAACIRDKRTGFGGLNHFLLPGTEDKQSARYGAYAMEVLINDILSRGAYRGDLEAKVFGGGEVIDTGASLRIGQRNAEFVREYLSGESIPIMAEDVGGTRGRRVFYIPATGKAHVQYLDTREGRRAVAEEARLQNSLKTQPKTGGVELF